MPDESWADVSVNGFCKRGTTTLLDMQTFNSDAGYYLRKTSAKDLETTEKVKMDKCVHPNLECRCSFTPMVYSTDGNTGREAVAAHQLLLLLLSDKLKQEYSKMCGFVKALISLAIVITNTLPLRGARDKEAYIRQKTIMEDVSVMARLAPWGG